MGVGSGSTADDYLQGEHREPYRQAGLWGVFRVYSSGRRAFLRLVAVP